MLLRNALKKKKTNRTSIWNYISRIRHEIGPKMASRLHQLPASVMYHLSDISIKIYMPIFLMMFSAWIYWLKQFKHNTRMEGSSHHITVEIARCHRKCYANIFPAHFLIGEHALFVFLHHYQQRSLKKNFKCDATIVFFRFELFIFVSSQ